MKMSGLDEQHCDISVCPNCDKGILTWPFVGKGKGHYNIDLNGNSHLNNTVFLLEEMGFSDIEHIYCYGCGHIYDKDSIMFRSVIIEAKKAKITIGE